MFPDHFVAILIYKVGTFLRHSVYFMVCKNDQIFVVLAYFVISNSLTLQFLNFLGYITFILTCDMFFLCV